MQVSLENVRFYTFFFINVRFCCIAITLGWQITFISLHLFLYVQKEFIRSTKIMNTARNVNRHLYKRSESTKDINDWSSIFCSFRYTKNNSDRGKNSLKVCVYTYLNQFDQSRIAIQGQTWRERVLDNLQRWCKQCNLASPCGQPSFQLSWCPFRHTKGFLQGKNQLWTFNKITHKLSMRYQTSEIFVWKLLLVGHC